MLTLALDTTAKTAAVALYDGRLLCDFSVNNTKTHSENLIYMINSALECIGKKPSDIERIAISAGPGSFTGVRIGVAAVKGLAFGKNIPIAPVSTLEALAENVRDTDHLICAAMDARRDQTYYAVFVAENGKIRRLCEDRADSVGAANDAVAEFCEKTGKRSVIFVGDGGELCHGAFCKSGITGILCAEHNRYQSGAGVAAAAERYFAEGGTVTAENLVCTYLRKPQAELG